MPSKMTKPAWRTGGDVPRPTPAPASSAEDALTLSTASLSSGGVASTTFVLTHPTHPLSRKLIFTSPPPWAMLIDRIIFLLAPSPFVASQLGLSYFDSERRRHLIDGQPGLLDLYNAVADDEEIRLRVVVREGGLSMGLKEIDEALRQMFLRRDLIDGPIPVFAHEPLQRQPRTRRSSTPESTSIATPGPPLASSTALDSPSQAHGALEPPPGLIKVDQPPGIWPPLSSSTTTLAQDDYSLLASPPASVASSSLSLPESVSDGEETQPRWITANRTADDDGDGWWRAESVAQGLRQLIEDFPAPCQPKRQVNSKTRPAGAPTAADIADGLRRLVGELRESMDRMDAIRARTFELVGNTLFAPSRTPSPPANASVKPLTPLLSPLPMLHHPVPAQLIPRPTYQSSPAISAADEDEVVGEDKRPLPVSAPALETPPNVTSLDADSEGPISDRQTSWAYLPTALLDFEGGGSSPAAGQPPSRGPSPPFSFMPQRPSDQMPLTVAATFAPSEAPSRPAMRIPTPPPLSLDEFPPLDVAATTGKKAVPRVRPPAVSTQGSRTSSTASSILSGASAVSSEAYSATRFQTPATSVDVAKVQHVPMAAQKPTLRLPSKPSGRSSPSLALPDIKHQHHPLLPIAGLTSGQRNQLMATAAPFVSRQQQYQGYGIAHHQQMPHFVQPSQGLWTFPTAVASNSQAFAYTSPNMVLTTPYGQAPPLSGSHNSCLNPYLINGLGWGGEIIPHSQPYVYPQPHSPSMGWLQMQGQQPDVLGHTPPLWQPTPTTSALRLGRSASTQQPTPLQPQQQHQRKLPPFSLKPTQSQSRDAPSAPASAAGSTSSTLPTNPASLSASSAHQQLATMRKDGHSTSGFIPCGTLAGWIDSIGDEGEVVAGVPWAGGQ